VHRLAGTDLAQGLQRQVGGQVWCRLGEQVFCRLGGVWHKSWGSWGRRTLGGGGMGDLRSCIVGHVCYMLGQVLGTQAWVCGIQVRVCGIQVQVCDMQVHMT